MSGKRPVGPEDVARGERFTALRATKWKSQAAMAKETGIDRLRVMRLESGEERFTTAAFQEEVAAAFGLPASSVIDYVRGNLALDALLEGERQTNPGSEPPPQMASDTYPNRAAFFALHGDQISAQTRAFLESRAFSSGDKSIDEWREAAKIAEHNRATFGVEIRTTGEGIGDPGGFGTPPPRRGAKRQR